MIFLAMIEGMELASVYAQQYPGAAAGPLEVARLFKAADLNLSRANAYLRFRKGKSEVDPVPPFLLEQQQKEQTATATPAIAPVAEPQDATVAPVTDDEQTPEPEREPEATDEAPDAEVRP